MTNCIILINTFYSIVSKVVILIIAYILVNSYLNNINYSNNLKIILIISKI